MANILNTVKQTKSFVAKLTPLIDLVNLLEELGSVEQAGREAEARLESAKEELKVVEANKSVALKELDAIKNYIESAKNQFEEDKKYAHEELDAAEAEASKIVSDARKEATTIVNHAVTQANNTIKASQIKVSNLETTVKDLERIKDLRLGELDDITSKIEETKRQALNTIKSGLSL